MFPKMRRYKQQLEQERCVEILKQEPRGVLALSGQDGYPYAVPMNFVYDDGCLYFHSAVEGHKLDAIRACSKASFCVLDKGVRPDGEWAYYFDSVIVFGKITVVTDEAARQDKLRKLGRKYFPTEEMVEHDLRKNAARALVLKMAIEHLTGKHVHEN